jgi:hypothetical protein
VRALRKETTHAIKEWSALSVEDRAHRLTDPPSRRRTTLAATCSSPRPQRRACDRRIAQWPAHAGRAGRHLRGGRASPLTRRVAGERGATARKKCTELQKKVRYLEGRSRGRRTWRKRSKRDLLQRKGELAEARMLAERLRKELDETGARRPTPPRRRH